MNPLPSVAVLVPAATGVEIPPGPALLAVAGLALVAVFLLSAVRAKTGLAARQAQVSVPRTATPASLPAPTTPPPLPAAPQFKRAPFVLHFPQIPAQFPDVWGVGEPFETLVRTEDKDLQAARAIPGLGLFVDGEPVALALTKGSGTARHTFKSTGSKNIIVEMRVAGEPQPRRTTRTVKVVEYRTEIAEVFATFKEEAGRTIAPLREDATPWEIFDILTSANPKIPSDTLRRVIASYEEAKYSNHRVTRTTYEQLITSLLQLERVDL